ncbi:MAG: bifunctional DNA-formamidopyrimidine glycosylase/DNA-(apurinic or apyrimidinic site) lyase [Chloroflexi bacterium]|nr:bifunctional DNA-formamidopyrimidine glycosylase/DNA-(apurinic or apyrimidinic site) lyase [Chloroflexota bacterium]
MPELPEVETIKNELIPHVVGRRITGVNLYWENMVLVPSASELRARLTGQKIVSVSRRGKLLIFGLASGESSIIHLRMTGSLLIMPALAEPEKHVRAVFKLDNGTAIHFYDPRKFGKMWLVRDVESVIGKLGMEPFDPSFTPEYLAGIMSNRTAPVKVILGEQSLIAGIGNMYADEALFAAKIYPLRPGKSLSGAEIKRLHRSIRNVLDAAIANKGASVQDYFRPGGETGTAHYDFKVAHRGGKLCPVCRTPIKRIAVRQRGTYFCPKCQREMPR